MPPLQDKLRGLLGAKYVPGVPLAQYAVDGKEPQVVVQLDRPEEIRDLAAWSHNHQYAIIPWGGGTSMSIGNPPARYDIALSMRELNKLVAHTPEDMTVTVQAGLTLGELQKRLGIHDQFLPVEAPADATIGGILASNRYGPSRLAWGMARDWLIGVRFVTGDGKLVHGGGNVVKNVAGYDLCKLLVGSYGSLGVITEATFKVAPLPEARCTCLTTFDHVAQVNASPLRPQFVELMNPPACRALGIEPRGDDTVLIGFSGTRDEVKWQEQQLAAKRVECDPSQFVALGSKEEVLLRIVCQPSEVRGAWKRLRELFGESALLHAHANLGVFRCGMPASCADPPAIRKLRLNYQAVIERAPLGLKKGLDVWGDPSSPIGLMKKIKQELDPRAILCPGRFAGGL